MDNYVKGEKKVLDDDPLPTLPHVLDMRVKNGSKIRNLMEYALKKFKDPALEAVTWNATGPAVHKATSCAELFKRKFKNLHQTTKIFFKREEEMWEPTMEGLERLCVTRNTPAIRILLSKKPLDPEEPGYQPPGSFDAFSINSQVASQSEEKRKRSTSEQHAKASTYQPKPGKYKRKKDKGQKTLTVAEGKERKTAQNHTVKEKSRQQEEMQKLSEKLSDSIDSVLKSSNNST